jgi:hypothetical protein
MELCGSGAVADTEDSSIPKTQREAAFNCAALHQWDIHVDDPQCVVAAEKVRPSAPSSSFLLLTGTRSGCARRWAR